MDIIEGTTRLKKRRASKQDITAEQIAIFFETLEDSCNVVRSAKAAGFAANWAYRKRKADAAFRDGWAQAVGTGYAKLEMILLERALKGTPKLVRASGGKDRIMREYSPTLAIALLRRHAEMAARAEAAAASQPSDDELAEVREEILRKLDAVRRRDFGEVETKGWPDAVAVYAERCARLDLLALAFAQEGMEERA